MNKYIVGGIVIKTGIDLPELRPTTVEEVDVVVEYGKVEDTLANPTTSKVLFSTNSKGEVLIIQPEVARYLIKDCSSILIEVLDEKLKENAHKYLLTIVLGVLSYKKGFFPLRGGGVVHNGEAYLFTGGGGAGKSTILTALHERGFKIIGDDIANLYIHKSGEIYVHPCFPRFKLWKESLNILGKKNQEEYRMNMDMEKYLIPFDNYQEEPVAVKRIYLLKENLKGDFSFQKIKGSKKLLKLKANSYRPWMVNAFGIEKTHFALMFEMMSQFDFKEFHRPKSKAKFSEMIEFIEAHIKGE